MAEQVDVGMGFVKAGLVGEPAPSLLVPAYLCHLGPESEHTIHLGLFNKKADLIEAFLRTAIYEPLRLQPKRHPLVMAVSPYQSLAHENFDPPWSMTTAQHDEGLYNLRSTLTQVVGAPSVLTAQ